MTTGQITKFSKGKGYESIPRELLQDTNLSLEAIGLLSYMQSLPENWKLYKTELYTRFPKNKRSVIDRIWKELIENRYLLNFKKRQGKKYVYNYIFSVVPFSEDDITAITKEQNSNDFWSVDFQQSNLNSSKSTAIKLTKEKLTINKSISKDIIDDDELNKNKQMEKLEKLIQEKSELKYLAQELFNSNIPDIEILKILNYFNTHQDTINADAIEQQLKWMTTKSKTDVGISSYSVYFIKGYNKRVENMNVDASNNVAGNLKEKLGFIDEELPKVPMFNWLEKQ